MTEKDDRVVTFRARRGYPLSLDFTLAKTTKCYIILTRPFDAGAEGLGGRVGLRQDLAHVTFHTLDGFALLVERETQYPGQQLGRFHLQEFAGHSEQKDEVDVDESRS